MAQKSSAAKKVKKPATSAKKSAAAVPAKKAKTAVSSKAVVKKSKSKAAAPKSAPAKTPLSKKAMTKKSTPAPAASEPAAPVKKASSGLTKADLNYFRNLLIEKRRELLGDVGSMESEAFKGGANLSNMPIHMADVGTDNFEQEFTLGLIESERQILREIQEALIRIDGNTFGVCIGTNKPIPRVRLEAVPWAKYTIEYSRLLESGKISHQSSSSSDDDSDDDED